MSYDEQMPGTLQQIMDEYLSGSHSTAWAKLAGVHLSQIDAGGAECVYRFVRGVIRNIAEDIYALHDRLTHAGFAFDAKENAIVPAGNGTLRALDRVEEEIGAVPLILRCFFEVFDSVNFLQTVEQSCERGSEFHRFRLYGSLIVANPEHAVRRWQEANDDSNDPETLKSLGRTTPYFVERFVETGPLLSSGEPVGFQVPTDVVDCEYYRNLVTGEPVLFVEELRKCIHYSGCRGMEGLSATDPMRLRAIELAEGLGDF